MLKKPVSVLAILGAVMLATSGCVTYVTPPTVITDPPPITEEPDLEPEETETPEVTWQTFSDERIGYTFEVPGDWIVDWLGGNPDYDSQEFGVYSPDNELEPKLYFWTHSFEAGENCGGSDLTMRVEEVASEKVELLPGEESGLRFVYRVATAEGYPWVGSLALTAASDDLSGSCGFVNISYSEPGLFADAIRVSFLNPEYNPDHEFLTREEAIDYMQTPEYETLKRIITSVKLK